MFRTKIIGIADIRGRKNLKGGEVVVTATMGKVRPIIYNELLIHYDWSRWKNSYNCVR